MFFCYLKCIKMHAAVVESMLKKWVGRFLLAPGEPTGMSWSGKTMLRNSKQICSLLPFAEIQKMLPFKNLFCMFFLFILDLMQLSKADSAPKYPDLLVSWTNLG